MDNKWAEEPDRTEQGMVEIAIEAENLPEIPSLKGVGILRPAHNRSAEIKRSRIENGRCLNQLRGNIIRRCQAGRIRHGRIKSSDAWPGGDHPALGVKAYAGHACDND